jgi:hypothetical protein
MAYADIAALAADRDFAARTEASYAVETLAQPDADNPPSWQATHAWDMAAQPGFGEAYAYAIANGNGRPGYDPAVITDGMILAAVQSLITPPPDPEVEP